MTDQRDLFELIPQQFTAATDPNPCVRLWGLGPEGTKCKTCVHLVVRQFANRYFKCRKRKMTSGPGTDHRVGWNACGLYEPKEKDDGGD
jgi:hypothetical protein